MPHNHPKATPEPGDFPLNQRSSRRVGKPSSLIEAADALQNTPDDLYPEGKPYASAVDSGPEPKPRSVSKNSNRSQ
jgi:hypothetical protein